jgi:hypothetical protein
MRCFARVEIGDRCLVWKQRCSKSSTANDQKPRSKRGTKKIKCDMSKQLFHRVLITESYGITSKRETVNQGPMHGCSTTCKGDHRNIRSNACNSLLAGVLLLSHSSQSSVLWCPHRTKIANTGDPGGASHALTSGMGSTTHLCTKPQGCHSDSIILANTPHECIFSASAVTGHQSSCGWNAKNCSY